MSEKSDANHYEGDETLREPLLEVQPVPVPAEVPVPTPIDAIPVPIPVPVDDVEASASTSTNGVISIDIDESDWEHGEVQPTGIRDAFWAFLFIVHFCAIATLSVMGIVNFANKHDWSPMDDDVSTDDDDSGDGALDLIVTLLFLMGVFFVVPAVLVSLLLGPLSSMLIQLSLVMSPLSFFITFVASFLSMNCPVAFFSLIMAVVGVYYAVQIWHKIPFATAHLQVALAAIKDNHGLWILSYLTLFKSYLWILLWTFAVVQVVVFSPNWIHDNCSPDNDEDCPVSTRGKFLFVGMLLSLFWTSQVVSGIFRTTVAGVVGTWWFDPVEARSASASGQGGCFSYCCGCSPAIWKSWVRSSFYSLGSVAFGSLLVGILKLLQIFVRCGRQQRDQQRRMRGIEGTDFVFCLLQFVVDHLERLVEYVNIWAYVYVGLYGYDYWTAGKQVAGLFKARGWSVIINDNLMGRSLSMMSLFICLITGLLGLVLGFVKFNMLTAIWYSVMGFILGGASCQVLFGVVTSAVNTVMVCFAESPNQLLQNDHDPKHFSQLVDAYRKAYPDECGF